MSRQEVAFLEKARKIGGCGSLKRIFMPDLYQNFRILGCDMADELKFIALIVNRNATLSISN